MTLCLAVRLSTVRQRGKRKFLNDLTRRAYRSYPYAQPYYGGGYYSGYGPGYYSGGYGPGYGYYGGPRVGIGVGPFGFGSAKRAANGTF